jgi:hypothetical protein
VRTALLSRLERLESRAAVVAHHTKLRFGDLRRLPPDYKGEKHVVIAKARILTRKSARPAELSTLM